MVGAFGGTLFGIIISAITKADFNIMLVSWLLGMFITLLVVTRMATSERWTKTQKYVAYEEENIREPRSLFKT